MTIEEDATYRTWCVIQQPHAEEKRHGQTDNVNWDIRIAGTQRHCLAAARMHLEMGVPLKRADWDERRLAVHAETLFGTSVGAHRPDGLN